MADPVSVLFWLHQAHSAMRMQVAAGFRRHGHNISAEQWALIVELWQHGAMTQSDLSARTGRDAPSVSRMLANMEKKGWVVREALDRRSNGVHLTKSGKDLHDLLLPIFQEVIAQTIGSRSDSDIATTISVLKAIGRSSGGRSEP